MTDKEFRRLSRSQLVDIIYELQIREEELMDENERLKEELADRRLRISRAGNIAEAALEINNVMKSAQNAAEQYLEEIQLTRLEIEKERQRIISLTKEEAVRIIRRAKREAAMIIKRANRKAASYDLGMEDVPKMRSRNR